MDPDTSFGAIGDDRRRPRKLVLCFDGTGDKFHGDDSDSNILKIFRMLDRSAIDQYHYYQPGIGTYAISTSLTNSGYRARFNSWYQKTKDSAVGTSFDQHVVGGYRFLMRFYNPGDEIYIFGFSRGAYIARFLAQMLDHIGLLSHGNEEMVRFAWKAFAQWQSRPQSTDFEGREKVEAEFKTNQMYEYMKGFRETFSRPVGRIRFLGLFDTVNSVPRFETSWMQRSKFPYTARSSAKVIRHAVSIDERRAKFRQDLMYQRKPGGSPHRHQVEQWFDQFRQSHQGDGPLEKSSTTKSATNGNTQHHDVVRPDDQSRPSRKPADSSHYTLYRPRSRTREVRPSEDDRAHLIGSEASPGDGDGDDEQDIDEVWFAGGHGDVGGGWEALDDRKSASHVPLAWIVREAMKAGLTFDMEKVADMECCIQPVDVQSRGANPAIRVQGESDAAQADVPEINDKDGGLRDVMHKAHTSRLHDSLQYGGGLGAMAVTAWKLMEYLPFRRMDLQPNGSWKPIRWPLPRGEVRDIPDGVRVHGSVIRRLNEVESYRPGNLIMGGGGRGKRRAPKEYGIGDWVCVDEPGDAIGEIWVKRGHAGKQTDSRAGD
ncbi:oxidoreductase, short chain dehydrogenase/reductase family [Metarhizium guizhouense ARSEF 977]|uniref:Oxidoreductase, short chain dehydrogenase/reductase family n=1 Tax=Metarhizium guizhouense (strain ARSEF 977) TaxID=1276136 RepID=A0A0B4GFN0_METGA|nr:oxidoreductase, short chain dehydrogenase/reductase family [Metarhizium guizhouense ARSEF 977]